MQRSVGFLDSGIIVDFVMKNILVVGGIEFCCVSGDLLSLQVDGKIKILTKLEKKQVYELLSKQIEELILTDERIVLQ